MRRTQRGHHWTNVWLIGGMSLFACRATVAESPDQHDPQVQIVELPELGALFAAVLTNLATNYAYEPGEPGNWRDDSNHDAGTFAAYVLYRYGHDYDDPTITRMAEETVEHIASLIPLVMEDLQANDYKDLDNPDRANELMVGMPALIEDARYHEESMELMAKVVPLCFGVLYLLDQNPNSNPMCSEYLGDSCALTVRGALATIGFEVASITPKSSLLHLESLALGRAALKSAERNNWVDDTRTGYGYYENRWLDCPEGLVCLRRSTTDCHCAIPADPCPKVLWQCECELWTIPPGCFIYSTGFDSYTQGTMLLALSRAYAETGDRTFKQRFDEILNYMNAAGMRDTRWEKGKLVTDGYFQDLTDTRIKALADNSLIANAMLVMHQSTGSSSYLSSARHILHFIERDLYREDIYEMVETSGGTWVDSENHFPGYGACYHDMLVSGTDDTPRDAPGAEGMARHHCTGCNFLLLDGVYLLNCLVSGKEGDYR